jgi:transcriptional regulator with XRE-family HTH domain
LSDNGAFHGPDEPIGSVLARMRRAKGLTGAQVGRLTGMSQPKISRIENAKGQPDPQDVGRIARALEADDALVARLVKRAELANDRMTDWQPSAFGIVAMQQSIGGFEDDITVLRCFEPTMVHGLLQTSEYARVVFEALQRHRIAEVVENPDAVILEGVASRLQRQEALSDPRKSFHFVLSESVLSNRFCPPDFMLGQIRRLRQIHEQFSNVDIRIIPETVVYPVPPMHGFEIFDDRLVMADVFNTGLTTQAKLDVEFYSSLFGAFEAISTTAIEPILDRYSRHYARQLLAE